MPDRDHVPVGRVGRAHGIDGAFVVQHPSADERRYAVGSRLYVDGEPAAVTLSRRAGASRRAIKLDRPVERGAVLTVPAQELPPPEPDHFYVFQLVGLDAFDEEGRALGVVADVAEGVANDNLVLASGTLVPMIEDAVLDVDLVQRRVVIARAYAD
jgi:16S rRNA processing protein RimM